MGILLLTLLRPDTDRRARVKLPFYVSLFRIAGRRESADTLVDKIKEQLCLIVGAAEESWQTFHNTGFVTDSPNVNRSARTKLL